MTVNIANPSVSRSQGKNLSPTETTQVEKPVTLSDFSSVISQEKSSVVKVQGYGCGGILIGSGFVVAPNIVATNAHVVAGVSSPQVIDSSGDYMATTVLFDPKLDFAVLRVNSLSDKPLILNQSSSYAINWVGSHNGDHDVFLGYPGGGFKVDLAVIADEYDAEVRDIYGGPYSDRDIYKITADVAPGNSGGPLVQQNGQVAGVVFGIPPNENDSGLVLPTTDFYGEVQQAKTLYTSVNTQGCADLSVR